MLPGLYATPGSVWPIDYPIRSHPSQRVVSFLTLLSTAEDLLHKGVYLWRSVLRDASPIEGRFSH